MLNTRHGVVVVENLRLTDTARDHVHEFLLVIVTATQIGVALGKLSSVTAAALVCAGLLSVLIFPLIALVLLRQGKPVPAPVVDTAATAVRPEPEPHLM